MKSQLIRAAAAVFGLGASVLTVWAASDAAFTSTTTNPADAVAAGTVTITDDDGGSTPATGTAMFSASGLAPGAAGSSKCLKATYTGSLPSVVRMYSSGTSGTLGTYLNLTIEVGSGGTFASCTGFSASSTLYSGTLAAFTAARTNYSTGLGTSWSPSTNGANVTFKLTYSVQNNPAAASLSAGATFVWEAQNT